MAYPEDDSCPRCGESNGSGLPCTICPVRCNECGHSYIQDEDVECPLCRALEIEILLTKQQAECLKDLLK